MNRLPLEKRTQIAQLLVEGNSLCVTCIIRGCSNDTVAKLPLEVGKACHEVHNWAVVNVDSKRVQCAEIWSFVYSKVKNAPVGVEYQSGEVWIWVGQYSDFKLFLS